MKEFEKVIGYEAEKQEMYRILDTMINPEKYQMLGANTPKGLLLSGEPGVGKTLMANCFIKASGRKAWTIRKDQPDGKFIERIEEDFLNASREAEKEPAIVFLDDMDKFANGDRNHRNSEEYIAVQSCIDKYCRDGKVFVLATVNDEINLPSSLLRKGRFDVQIDIDCPKGKDAELIVEYFLKDKKCDENVNAMEIAKLLDGRSCATLESVINEAVLYAGYENRERASRNDIIRAFSRLVYDAPEEIEEKESPYDKEIAYHEAGHALVSEILEPESVNYVTIKKFKGNVQGFTNFKNNDDYFKDIDFMKNRVMALLAGKAATEVVFGKVDVGATGDVERAFRIAERFVDDYCSYGFAYTFKNNNMVSDFSLGRREHAVAGELEKLYNDTKRLLASNRSLLDSMVKKLLENKLLFPSDIADIKTALSNV